MHFRYMYVVVKELKTLDVAWCLCICVCVCVFVGGSVWCRSLYCVFAFRSVRQVCLCLCKINMKQTPWYAADTLSEPRDASRPSSLLGNRTAESV
jgi:hypothetical protein